MLELGGLFYLWRLYSASGVTFFYCVGIIESHWFQALFSPTRVAHWDWRV